MALRFRVRTFKRCETLATRGVHTQTLARKAILIWLNRLNLAVQMVGEAEG